MKRTLIAGLIVAALLLAVVLPLSGQTATPDPSTEVVVVGTVDLQQGVIMVNGFIIAPGSAFLPPILHQGDEVIIIGNLLPDGVTILASSFEFFDDSAPEATVEPTVEVTVQPTPEVTVEPTVEVTPEVTLEPGCNQTNHPVAQQLADNFGVSYAEIINWHCNGFGFGEIARAYLLADATGDTADAFFAQRQSGQGWGQIVKETGVHPSELAPGQVIRPGSDFQSTDEPGDDNARGNGQGNGNGNGGGNGNGNGNGGGNGNGNGNGNGRGNGNGNGRGNGNGNGRGSGK